MAATSSFKQQCPSCEALVPIRDPKLVGRKIDCPKCKYRFVVEAPAEEPDDDATEDEAAAPQKPAAKPAAKTKAGANGAAKKSSTAVTKKPTAKAKAAPEDAGDEATEEDGPAKKKKAAGKSNTLIIGIGLAAVALIALGVGAVFLFGGGDKNKSASNSGQASNQAPRPGGPGTTPQGPARPNAGGPLNKSSPLGGAGKDKAADPGKDKPKDTKEEKPAAEPGTSYITNLLPNDTQAIVSIPVSRLKATPFRYAISAPGAFNDGTFARSFSVPLDDVKHILLAANLDKDWIFTVVQTDKAVDKDTLVRNLQLVPETPAANGMEAFHVRGALDGLSSFLLKANLPRRDLLLHLVDTKTLVLADAEPMKQFLEHKGKVPPHPSQAEKTPEAKDKPGPGEAGAPGQGRKTMARPNIQPPGGQPGAGGPAPVRGGAAGGQPGATQPPEKKPEEPAAPPYRTVSADLKKVIEEVEKGDQSDVKALLSTAMETKVFLNPQLQHFLQDELQSRVGRLRLAPVRAVVEQFRVIGFGLVALGTENTELVVAGLHKEEQGPDLVKDVHKELPGILSSADLDVAEDAAPARPTRAGGGPGNAGRMGSGGAGRMGGGGAGRMGGGAGRGLRPGPAGGGLIGGAGPPAGGGAGTKGAGGPPGLPPNIPGLPPGISLPPGANIPAGIRGGNFNPAPGGQPGVNPAGPPAGAAPGGPQGKDGTWAAWSHGDLLITTLNLRLKDAHYKAIVSGLRDLMVSFRGKAAVADTRSRIFDLAHATQEYLQKNGHFPRGTLARATTAEHVVEWPPDQRLSWMFELLPLLGSGEYQDLHSRIKPDKSWSDDANRHLSMLPVPFFLAPPRPGEPYRYRVHYPGQPGTFAATNWVGVAGVGLDAAYYLPTDSGKAAKLGVFGYDRETRREDVKDGLSNTILLLMVPPAESGPWAAGGGSTVRGISEDADCFKPFVCAEYRGKRGTFAIMADGKVRFIAETVPPNVFRALCTIAGNDKVNDLEAHAPLVEEESDKQVTTAPKADAPPPAKPAPAAKGEESPGKVAPAAKAEEKPMPK